jgi:hypothetical protein
MTKLQASLVLCATICTVSVSSLLTSASIYGSSIHFAATRTNGLTALSGPLPGTETNFSGPLPGTETNFSGPLPGTETNFSGPLPGTETNFSGPLPGTETNLG